MIIKVDNGRKPKFQAGKKTGEVGFSNGRGGPQITFKNGTLSPTKRLKVKLDKDWYELGDLVSRTKYYTTMRLEPVEK